MSYDTILIRVSTSSPNRPSMAAEEIMPGNMLRRTSAGHYIKHNALDGYCKSIIAIENHLEGKSIDYPYSIGDYMLAVCARKGDEVYAWLSAGVSVSVGDYLSSAGDGSLKKAEFAMGDGHVVATALEAIVDSGAAVRIRVETE